MAKNISSEWQKIFLKSIKNENIYSKILRVIEFDNQYHSEIMSKFLNENFTRNIINIAHKMLIIILLILMNVECFEDFTLIKL